MLCRRDVKMVQRRLYGALGTLWGPRDFKGISGCLERTWCNNQTCSKSSPLPSFASQSEIVNVIYQHIPLSYVTILIIFTIDIQTSERSFGAPYWWHNGFGSNPSWARVSDVTNLDQTLQGLGWWYGCESSRALEGLPGPWTGFQDLWWRSREFKGFPKDLQAFKGLLHK